MMTVGDILADARRSAGKLECWFDRIDPELGQRAAGAAADSGQGIAGYARMAAADFARLASEEDWATLMSALRDSPDPGSTCLAAMIRWRLSAPVCQPHATPHSGAGDARS